MKDPKKTLLKYGITTGVMGLITVLIAWLRNFSLKTPFLEKLHILSDAFFAPGICLVLFSLLMWASTEGAFDFFGYAFSRIGGMFVPLQGAVSKHETYYDYVARKRGKRLSGFWFLTFVGLAFATVGIVFMILLKIRS